MIYCISDTYVMGSWAVLVILFTMIVYVGICIWCILFDVWLAIYKLWLAHKYKSEYFFILNDLCEA